MVTCPVCGTENDDLTVRCSSCRAYVQAKVDSLDLFNTIWALVESPRAAFKRIVLSQHKNYVVLLSALMGVYAALFIAWARTMGTGFSNIVTLAGTGIVVGPFLGMTLVAVVSMILSRLCVLAGGRATFRNTFAVISYAGVPLVAVLVLVFPLQAGLFGVDLFGSNPPPSVINPPLYFVLMGFHVIALALFMFLLLTGLSVAGQLAGAKALLVGGSAVGLVAVFVFLVQVL
jgi:hypothetical protein